MALFWIDTLDLAAFGRQLDRIEYRLKTLTQQGATQMGIAQDILAEVTETAGAVESVKVYIESQQQQNAATIAALQAEIDRLKAAGTDPETQAVLQQAVDQLNVANEVLKGLVPAVQANAARKK